jgi:hypothetical protein
MDRLSSGKNQPWASPFSAADYDTNQDPIVRASAAEIRKRIAQHYHEPVMRPSYALNCHSVHMYRYFIWPRPHRS